MAKTGFGNNLFGFFRIYYSYKIKIMDTVVPNGDKKMDESNNTDLAEVKNKPVYKEYNNSEDGLEILSKRAQKKLLKRKLWLESKPERRAKEKAKQKAKIDRIRQTKGKPMYNMYFNCI